MLQVLVSEHRRSRPASRLAALVVREDATAPRRMDVAAPSTAGLPQRGPLVSHRPRHRRPRLTTGKPGGSGRPTPANLGFLPRPPGKPGGICTAPDGVRPGASMSGMSHFLLEYRYVDMDARGRARAEHLDYLNRLQAEGTLVMAGPLADTTGAVGVLDVADEAAVQDVIAGDPYTRRTPRPTTASAPGTSWSPRQG